MKSIKYVNMLSKYKDLFFFILISFKDNELFKAKITMCYKIYNLKEIRHITIEQRLEEEK